MEQPPGFIGPGRKSCLTTEATPHFAGDGVRTVIRNTSANPISGTFSNLADGAIVNVNGNNLQASYRAAMATISR